MTGIFDGYPKAANPGTVVPGNAPSRPNEYYFKREWYIDQVYDPDKHDVADVWKKYVVPYEGELVKDTVNKKLYIVSHVDVSTWKSTLVPFEYTTDSGSETEYPLYPKSEYGMLQGEFPLFVDYSVLPPVCRVSSLAYQSNPAYAKLFYGNIIDESTGQVISAIYSNKDLVTDKIPVVTVMPAGFNVEQDIIKCADTFSVILPKEKLKNGTRCTLVYFDQNGFPLAPTYSLMTQHCEYLRNHQIAKRYVKTIELISPWFTNSTTPNVLYLPVNLPLVSVEFRARIHYSDGTSETKPVNSYDGRTGFVLHGVDSYKPTSPNQRGNLTLTYYFANGEESLVAQPGLPDHMSVSYTMIAVNVDGAYSPRLYTFPYWDSKSGYKLKHFLTDLTRKVAIDVTEYVKLNNLSPAFSGNNFGTEQGLIFNLTLSDVANTWNNWTFVQYTTITLYNSAMAEGKKWGLIYSKDSVEWTNMTLEYIPDTNVSQRSQFAGYTSVDDFIEKAYYAFEPSYDVQRELKAPAPTHMKLIRENNTSVTVPVAGYNNLDMGSMTLNNGETFFIVWINRDKVGNELQLGMSAAVTKKVSNFTK